MFSNITIGLLAGLGFGAWVYGKLMRSTGGNTQNALVGAGAVAFITFLLILTTLALLF
jgi:hypothetical protein